MFAETLGLELTSLSRWPASLSVKRGAFAVTGGGGTNDVFRNVWKCDVRKKKSFLKQKSARHAITESLVWLTVGHTSKELN